MTRGRGWRRAWAIACILGALGAAPGSAAEFSGPRVNYIAADQNVRQVLRDFAATQDVSVVVSERVDGTISGNFSNMDPRRFMEEMARLNGLIWYLFGQTLYVYDASESVSQIFTLVNSSADILQRSLIDLDIYRDRFVWRADNALGLVLVSGPPRYIDLVQQIIGVVETQQASQPKIQVFRLRHASAIDRVVTYRDQQLVVPGLTAILRELLGLNPRGRGRAQTLPASVGALPGLRGSGLASVGQGAVYGAGGATPVQPVQPVVSGMTDGPASSGAAAPGPAPDGATDLGSFTPVALPDAITIESDSRLNAVVIKARADQLPLVAAVIDDLDVPTQLIQIDVTILDIAVSRLVELGVRWELFNGISLGVQSDIASTITAGLQIAGSISNPFSIMADVRALEQVGDATIVAQPSVITFDNVEAVIDESQSIYVRVAGDQDVDLYEVQTGTLLRVTPRIVQAPAGSRTDVELFVDIRDGDFTDEQVDTIPTVRESTLTTTAVVEQREGLLLGGLFRDSLTDTEEKVPILGDIPILGLAFRSKRTQQDNVARLFLITPTPIVLSPDGAPEAALPSPAVPADLAPRVSGAVGGRPPVPLIPAGAGASGLVRLEAREEGSYGPPTIACPPPVGGARDELPGVLTLPQIMSRLTCLASASK